MRIIAIRMLREFWQEPTRGDAEQALKAWFSFTSAADWNTPADVKLDYRNASILKIRRVVFNIAGIGYPLRSPIRSRSVLKTHKKTPMYGLISTHSYRIGNKGKFHNHES